jgi:hypothetical protein
VSNDADIMRGIAQRLHDAGLGLYDPTGAAYTDPMTLPAIVFKEMPDVPDRVICITAYTIAGQPAMPLDTPSLQIRTRGAPDAAFDCDDIAGAVFDNLHGATRIPLGTVTAVQILQRSSIPMGIDSNRRWERSDNYAIDANVPTTSNRPD